jgi:hypothetical protein
MPSLRWCALVCFAVLAGVAMASAQAPTTADVLRGWGLFGTWAENCAASREKGTNFFGWRASDKVPGGAQHVRDLPSVKDSTELGSAMVLPDGRLQFEFQFDGGSRILRNTWAKRADGRIRVVENFDLSMNRATVVDGRLVHSGRETMWLERCGD